jgi:hypothetical protein
MNYSLLGHSYDPARRASRRRHHQPGYQPSLREPNISRDSNTDRQNAGTANPLPADSEKRGEMRTYHHRERSEGRGKPASCRLVPLFVHKENREMRPTLVWHIVVLVITVFFSSFRQAHSEDPFTYFDGNDNNAYLEWLKGANYDRSTFLPSALGPTKGAAIHWTISGDKIYLSGSPCNRMGRRWLCREWRHARSRSGYIPGRG